MGVGEAPEVGEHPIPYRSSSQSVFHKCYSTDLGNDDK